MVTYSASGSSDNRFAAFYLDPTQLKSIVDGGGVSVAVATSDHFQLSAPDVSLDIYGKDLTYNGNLITGGTFDSESLDSEGEREFTLGGISLTVAQINSKSGDILALSDLVFSGDDAIQMSLTQKHNDVATGGTGRDTLQGGPGNDIMLGNQGDDVILGNQDNDEIYGGMDNDVVFAGVGADQATGNEGNDVVAGNEGNDTLHGGQGDDIVYGGQDDDLIYGDRGNDVLYGNQGADKFRFAQGDGADVIADFSKAEGDKIDLQGLGYTVSQNANGNAVLNVFGGSTIELAGIAAAAVDGTFFSA